LRRACVSLVRRHNRRGRRPHVVGPTANASGIELDADDALAAAAIDAGLHARRRCAAEQPAAEPDAESLKVAPGIQLLRVLAVHFGRQ
jgi:hypothetical protein